MKQGVIIGFLGKTQDRFSEYQSPASTREKLEIVSKIDGFDGVEMVYPYENGTPEETLKLMKEFQLNFGAINVNIKKETEWVAGALSRPDKAIRDRAVAMIKKAKDFAKAVGAPHVTCCPLSDGYDLLFQIDYKKAWNSMVETIGEASDYLPEIPLFVEPKYSETRVHCQLDSTAKALLLLKEVGNKNTGITLDFGHSLQSAENPAQSLVTIYESGFDAYIHTNDNDSKADWDLLGASRHFLHYVELMFWAQQYNYDKYFTTDASPRIFDILDFFNRHSEITLGAYNLAKSLNAEEILQMMKNEDFNGLMKLVNKGIYRI
ncbi:sugar phosphate isomerase/epimerase family protein [Algibacter sp. R77976]|uniref:sugar phosphate isomerase/epimerase family protein n=1 Tax=Algibacter sp. R77976 TaxID=3093873 RepID=UPI0037C8A294